MDHNPPLIPADAGYLDHVIDNGDESTMCKEKSPGIGYECTRIKNHTGPHAAHGSGIHEQYATWDNQ